MSYQQRRDEGAARETGGAIRRFFGRILGNRRLEAEGATREVSGRSQKEAAKTEGRATGKIEEVAGAVQNRVGELTGNDRWAAEGRSRELTGEKRQDANR